jgi:HEAT repeat protein
LLIQLLESNSEDVRWDTVELLGNLANFGERKLRERFYGTADANCEVEFRGAIAATIPSLSKLLEDEAEGIRLETVELIGNFTNHGEWQLENVAAQLMRIVKSSSVKP